MLARCARCQGTFTTDHYGRQVCPHCGSELILADPGGAPPPQPPQPPSGPEQGQGWGAAPPPPPGEPPPPFPPPPPAGGGWAPPPPPPGSGWSPPPSYPPPPPPQGDQPSPFADRGGRGFFGALLETWKLVAGKPRAFFSRVRTDQPGAAVLFGLVVAVASGIVAGFFGVLYNQLRMPQMQESLQRMPPEVRELMEKLLQLMPFASPNSSPWALGLNLVAIPIGYFIGLFVIAGVAHLFLLMFKGASRGFDATLTVVGYSYAVHAVQAVGGPFLGSYVAPIWQAVVLIIGLAAVHRADVWKSSLAVLLPAFLCCCCAMCGGFFAAASLVGAMHGAGGGTTNL